MNRIALGIALVAGFASPTVAQNYRPNSGWSPDGCPIMIRGKIVAVVEAKAGQKAADDLADIEITEVLKGELKDVILKAGDKLTVRMASRKNVGVPFPNDFNYPVKTEATWMIFLNAKGEYRIDEFKFQKLSIDHKWEASPRLNFNRQGQLAELPGKVTKAEWIKQVVDADKREAEERAKRDAEEREIREIRAELAKADRIDETSMSRFHSAPYTTRRAVLYNDTPEQTLKGKRFVEVAVYALAHDPHPGIRNQAIVSLERPGTGDGLAGDALVKALTDRKGADAWQACRVLGLRGEKNHAAAVRPLLESERGIRFMAVTTLGRLGDTDSLPAILKLYDEEKADPSCSATFANCLARLGEKKVALRAVLDAMSIDTRTSNDENQHFLAAEAMGFVESVDVIPVATKCLALELERIIAGKWRTGFGQSTYRKIIAVLVKQSGKDFGLDPVAWADWWETARVPHFAPALKIDVAAARKAYADHLKATKPAR